MKRRRSSVDCKITKGNEVAEMSPIHFSIIENVPETIMVEIFLRLSIKEIIMCKSVCKLWYHLIRMPTFARYHFERAQAQPCVVVRRSKYPQVCRMLYLIEPHNINVTCCIRDEECVAGKHKVIKKLDTTMKIPLRNIELLREVNGDLKTKGGGAIKKHYTKASSALHKFRIVNSCNGFLCLSEPKSNIPMTVCNPVTGEYLNLPGNEKTDGKMINVVCGFGYSPKLNKYKVIRIFEQGESQGVSVAHYGTNRLSHMVAETYTFGKGSWERIGNIPFSIYSYERFRHGKMYSHHFPIYCNGAVNWLHYNYHDKTACVCSFDLDEDCFKSIELPLACDMHNPGGTRLGELCGCLCLFYYPSLNKPFTIWVMNKHGSQSLWTKMITVDEGYCDRGAVCFSAYLPISYTEEAGLIMFSTLNSALVYLNSDFTYNWKCLRIRGGNSEYDAYLYVPTLLSLKDALTDEEEILNVNTMDIKLLGESKPVFLEEDYQHLKTPTKYSDSDSSDEDSDSDWSSSSLRFIIHASIIHRF